jgi:opacity protein-like surface antigen
MFPAVLVVSRICGVRPPRVFLAGTWLIALTGSTFAADLPVTKAPPPVIASWAGFYLGVHGGYAWSRDDFSVPAQTLQPLSINGIRSQGAVYGAQAGYNWQFGRVVTGLEVDFSATDIKGSNGVSEALGSASSSDTRGENVKYLGSARARLGWLPADKVLLYGTAGLAWERLDLTEDAQQNGSSFSLLSSPRIPTDKFGWVAGVGAEVMLGSPNWIGRIEYLHYDFGQVATASTSTSTAPSTAGSQTTDVVRAGVSYKFGEPAKIASVPYAKAPIAAPPSA